MSAFAGGGEEGEEDQGGLLSCNDVVPARWDVRSLCGLRASSHTYEYTYVRTYVRESKCQVPLAVPTLAVHSGVHGVVRYVALYAAFLAPPSLPSSFFHPSVAAPSPWLFSPGRTAFGE